MGQRRNSFIVAARLTGLLFGSLLVISAMSFVFGYSDQTRFRPGPVAAVLDADGETGFFAPTVYAEKIRRLTSWTTSTPPTPAPAAQREEPGEWREAITATLGQRPDTLPLEGFQLSVELEGNSWELAVVLAAIDAATPGELAGQLRIAATGTVRSDGTVSNVQAVNEKIEAAEAANADVVFVPKLEVRGSAGNAVEVSHVDDAILWLCQNGADDQICDEDES